MNNDQYIVIKSQGQPDEGEGHSRWQAAHGNVIGGEGRMANMRGNEQKPGEANLCRDESATQDKVLYSSQETGRRPGARAWKVNEHTPGGPLSVTHVTEYSARDTDRSKGVSRRNNSRRRNETGVAADGLPVQRRISRSHPDKGRNGAIAEWRR